MIYKPLVTEKFQWIITTSLEDQDIMMNLDGTQNIDKWNSLYLDIPEKISNKKQYYSDFPWWGSILITRQRVSDLMGDLLLQHSNLLPIYSQNGEKLHVVNCKKINALDTVNSKLMYIPNTTTIMKINKYIFKEDVIKNQKIFRISSMNVSPTFVNSDFVAEYKKHGFVGLDFIPIYKESWDTSSDSL